MGGGCFSLTIGHRKRHPQYNHCVGKGLVSLHFTIVRMFSAARKPNWPVLVLCVFTALFIRLQHRHLLRMYVILPRLNLQPSGEYFHHWNGSSPVIQANKLRISLFNLTNSEQVLTGQQQQLQVAEIGHFVFDQYTDRLVGNFSPDQRSVIYTDRNYYILNPTESTGELDSPIVFLNLPLMIIATHLDRFTGINNYMPLPVFGGQVFDSQTIETLNHHLAAHNESLFIRATVRQLLFGYRLSLARVFANFTSLMPASRVEQQFKAWFSPTDTGQGNFSLFGLFNNTVSGPYEIYTGLNGTRDVALHYRTYRGENRFDLWKSEHCNVIDGSDVQLFNLDLKSKPPLEAIITGVCRKFQFNFAHTLHHKGIPVYRYDLSGKMFKVKSKVNQCYCTGRSQCRWNGLLGVGPCFGDIPLFLSQPHFENVEPEIRKRHHFTLSYPLADNGSYIYVNPLLGLTIFGQTNFLISFRISNQSKLSLLNNVGGEYFVPLVQFTKQSSISNETASVLRQAMYAFEAINVFTLWLCLFTIYSLLFTCWC